MKKIKLSDIVTSLESGSRPKGQIVSEKGIPSIGGEHLNKDGGFKSKNIKLISEDYFNKMKKGVVSKNDILIVKDGATTGKISFVSNDFPFKVAALNEHVFRMQVDPIKASYKYVFYYLFSEKGQREILKDYRGATIGGISKNFPNKVLIPLPPIETQRRIAQILDKADALRRKNQQLLNTYDQLLQSTFLEMFGDPVTNPKGWKIIKISNCYIDKKNGTKCGPFGSALKKGEYTQSGIPVWTMDNIKPNRFDPLKCLYITHEKFKKIESYKTIKNDIIISRAGTVGKMCVVDFDGDAIISTNLIRLRFDSTKLLPIYFTTLMTKWGPNVARLKTGVDGSFTHMNTGVLNNIQLPVPPITLQNQFAQIVENIEAQKSALKKSAKQSDDLFNSLVQQAFNPKPHTP